MRARERSKQIRAKARAEGKERMAAEARALIDAALEAARGNPGLQDALTRPILNGEEAASTRAIETVETFHATGAVPPPDQDPGDFFQRMAFETYADALSGAEKTALSAATLFSDGIPIPRAALEAAAEAMGLSDPSRAMDRLLSLGLLDDWGLIRTLPSEKVPHVSLNSLARPKRDNSQNKNTHTCIKYALEQLAQEWNPDILGEDQRRELWRICANVAIPQHAGCASMKSSGHRQSYTSNSDIYLTKISLMAGGK